MQPFGMTGMPGANFGGTNISVPTSAGNNTPAFGGNQNPSLPQFPTGTSMPGTANPMAAQGGTQGFDVASLLGFGQGSNDPLHDITKALHKAGFSAGIAGELANFLAHGAGFNPEVAKALIAAMGPGIERGEASIMEQFSNMGLRGGSPAAIGLGDYLGQVQLNEGQIWAQLYEQSVQNYMNVLLAGKGPAPQNMFQNINQLLNTIANLEQGAGAIGKGFGGGGGGGKSG